MTGKKLLLNILIDSRIISSNLLSSVFEYGEDARDLFMDSVHHYEVIDQDTKLGVGMLNFLENEVEIFLDQGRSTIDEKIVFWIKSEDVGYALMRDGDYDSYSNSYGEESSYIAEVKKQITYVEV